MTAVSLFAICTAVAFGQKIKAEEVLARHLDARPDGIYANVVSWHRVEAGRFVEI